MAEAAQPPMVDIDPDFEPLSRPRSCTWPLPRPEFTSPGGGGDSNAPSPVPSVKTEPGSGDYVTSLSLLEESEDFPEDHKPSIVLCTDFQCQENCIHQQHIHQHPHQQHQHPSPQRPHHQQQVALLPSPVGGSSASAAPTSSSSVAAAAAAAAQRKSSSSRRNAWGNMSYADLITKAIESSPESRLTLSQIYDWMVKSVPYFKDKGDSNSSAGWKNSIRHNLSLHSRFVRVQNEGTGKSSWWMLNPEGGKSGKSPRRRAASMDNNSKFSKSRGRAAKKKLSLQGGPEGGSESPGSSYSKWPGSPNSHSNDDFDAWNSFRPRTSSNASTLSGRLSPFMPEDDLGHAHEGGDVHMVYPGAPGSKMASTLPSLTEMAGSLLGHSSENVMENLLDNLNLLSPNNSQVGGGGGASTPCSSQSSQSSPLMQGGSPGYPSYSSPSMGPPVQQQQQQQQDFRKCMYGPAGMNALTSRPMQPLAETKPSFGVPSLGGGYACPAGLLKELLTNDSEQQQQQQQQQQQHGDLMPPSVESAVSPPSGRCMLPSYSSVQHGAKRLQHGLAHPRLQPHNLLNQSPAAPMNGGHLLMSLNHVGGGSTRLPALKCPMQMPYGLVSHLGGGGGGGGGGGVGIGGGVGGLPLGYCPALSTNGYGRPGPLLLPQHHHHTERLPSDLDDMSIERFECDVESIIHDTLMDGDSLDFNFEPMVTQPGFNHAVKTTTHSWVSG